MSDFHQLLKGLNNGAVVPVLGPGALLGSQDPTTGQAMPAGSRSLILAMNNGREMMPRLMYEFSRAAQHLEQRRGQTAVKRFLTQLYSRPWTRSPMHEALAQVRPRWVVDLNRDDQLLQSYADTPHILIQGVSRIMERAKRFRLFYHDGTAYRALQADAQDEVAALVSSDIPILFKPLGCAVPEANFIASDADFVDYLTELMGGFAIPDFLKRYRTGKQYLLLGVPLSRDTERMLVSEISYGAGTPRGWVFLPEPTSKERRFCARQQIEIIEQPTEAFSDYLQQLQSGQQLMSVT